MTPLGPFSQRDGTLPSSRPMTLGGKVQRDVRLQAALALLIGIALVAVPLFIWGRGKKKHGDPLHAPLDSRETRCVPSSQIGFVPPTGCGLPSSLQAAVRWIGAYHPQRDWKDPPIC